MSIALVTTTAAGRRAAGTLQVRWPDARTYPVARIADAFGECEALVCFLAVGATVRLLAPLLSDKRDDPAVVCVDETARFAVAVLGGHAGANRLAGEVADALGAQPVVTTATDATGLAALDELGWPAEGDVAALTRALLDGEDVYLTGAEAWPLPPLPVRTSPVPRAPAIVVSDRVEALPRPAVVLRPPSLVAGVGASRGVASAEVLELLRGALARAQLSPASLAALATVTAKAAEPGLRAAAEELAVPLLAHEPAELARIAVPNPSEAARRAVGTPSVAEAAALAASGELVVEKCKSERATVAVARRPARGRLAVVGLGPGDRDLLTPQARRELRRASDVVGLDSYLAPVRELLRPGTRVHASPLGAESERSATAARLANAGRAVAVVGSGDAGVYGMAAPVLALLGPNVEVVGVPGVTAMLAAAALLGAPLGHDHAAISLSDLHTPWELIERRVRAAAESDLVVAFYNPRSARREWQLPKALAVLAGHRPPATPVGIVTEAGRPGQRVLVTTLAELPVEHVGMTSVVLIGSSASRVVQGRFVTPRGYRWE